MKPGIIAAVILGTVLSVMADFAEDFQEAKKLFDQRDYHEAHQSFVKLAVEAPNDHGQGACLSWGAIALGRHEQIDQAIELAKTIKSKPLAAYTQMEILSDNKKHQQLIAAFNEEDIAAWPDRINYKGFFLRGAAYSVREDRQAAIKDFQQCVDLAGSDLWVKLEALNNVGALYRDLDNAKAMETYQKAFAICDSNPNRKGRWLYPHAILAATRILIDQRDYDQALAVLAKFDDRPQNKTRGPWEFLVLEAYGDIFVEQGKKDDALAKYQDAVTIDTHQSYVDRVNKKIEVLKNEKERESK